MAYRGWIREKVGLGLIYFTIFMPRNAEAGYVSRKNTRSARADATMTTGVNEDRNGYEKGEKPAV